MREARARVAVGTAVSATLYSLWAGGHPHRRAPSDPAERRRREAEGAQWNTLRVGGARPPGRAGRPGADGVPAGQHASPGARRRIAAGEDPGEIATAVGNEVLRWSLSESYLRGPGQLGSEALAGAGRGAAAARPPGASPPGPWPPCAPSPPSTPWSGRRRLPVHPAGPGAPGLREHLPVRLDPADRGGPPPPGQRPHPRPGDGLRPRPDRDGRGAGPLRGTPAGVPRRGRVRRGGAERPAGPHHPAGPGERDGAPGAGDHRLEPSTGRPTTRARRRLLRRALDKAADEADIAAGEGVARDAKAQAARAWDAVPKFEGVKGDAGRGAAARTCASGRARSALGAAKTADPRNGGAAVPRRAPRAVPPGPARRPSLPRTCAPAGSGSRARYGVTLP